MKPGILKFVCVPIYIFYAYLFGWQVYYLNEKIFFTPSLNATYLGFSRYMPEVVFLLYSLLLVLNLFCNQRRILILNSFIVTTLLGLYDGAFALIMAIVCAVFGFVIAFMDVIKRDAFNVNK